MTHTEPARLAPTPTADRIEAPDRALPLGRDLPWREGLAALNLLIGGGVLVVAGWGLLVCDLHTSVCQALAWALPISALYALSGTFVGNASAIGHRTALALKGVALVLVVLFAVLHSRPPEADGWPLVAGAVLLAELAVLGLCPPGRCEPGS